MTLIFIYKGFQFTEEIYRNHYLKNAVEFMFFGVKNRGHMCTQTDRYLEKRNLSAVPEQTNYTRSSSPRRIAHMKHISRFGHPTLNRTENAKYLLDEIIEALAKP